MSEDNKKAGFIPYIFIIFFAVVFAINGFYIYISQKTWRGVATQDSYHKGLKYNETLEYVKSQKELGWNFKIKFLNRTNNLAEVTVCLLDKNKNHIKNAKLVAKLKRPTQEGYDFTQNFIAQNNCYYAKINFPLKGLWDVEIQGLKGDDVAQVVKRYVVQ